MALGEQFKNTYWFTGNKAPDGTGGEVDEVGFSLLERPEHARPSMTKPGDQSTPRGLDFMREEFGHAGGSTRYRKDDPIPTRGMLFSPHVGTGHRDDPTVSPERRRLTAETALGYRNRETGERTPVAEYQKRARMAFSTKPGDRTVHRDMDLLSEHLTKTPMSIREMEKVDTFAVRDMKQGRAWANIGGTNTTIRMTREQAHVKSTTPGYTEQIQKPSDTPIHNPRFWEWHDKNVRDGDYYSGGIEESTFDSHLLQSDAVWHHPGSGETISGDEAVGRFGAKPEEPDYMIGERPMWHHPEERTINALRDQGFVPNIFPGAGSSTKKHAATKHPIQRGYSYAQGRYAHQAMHLRHEPGETVTVEHPDKVTWEKKETVNRSTLVHEIGHTRDRTGNDRTGRDNRADPLLEGVADGYRIRHNEDILQSHLESTDWDPGPGGYGVKFSGWKNNTQRALYIAAKSHTAQVEGGAENAPSRERVRQEMNWSQWGTDSAELNAMTLGHTWEHYPHVRQHLEAAGFGPIAKKAHADYQVAVEDRRRSAARARGEVEWEQPRLPGLEW